MLNLILLLHIVLLKLVAFTKQLAATAIASQNIWCAMVNMIVLMVLMKADAVRTVVNLTSIAVTTRSAFSSHGDVTLIMIVVIILMKSFVLLRLQMLHASITSSLVPVATSAYQKPIIVTCKGIALTVLMKEDAHLL
uniref:Putative product n=1 Tax=Xenopsylla cheopis TaxID=163159 RepID=A0A6M2DVR7_XENCH